MTKKIFLLITILLLTALITYRIGFHQGCQKVIGKWEGAYITDDLIKSHCYGDRDMWRDAVEKQSGR